MRGLKHPVRPRANRLYRAPMDAPGMPVDPPIVYTSARIADCEERAFMLTAVGIPNAITFDGARFALRVEPQFAQAALAQLRQYETEKRPPPRPPPPPELFPFAWLGCVLYVFVLLGVAKGISEAW